MGQAAHPALIRSSDFSGMPESSLTSHNQYPYECVAHLGASLAGLLYQAMVTITGNATDLLPYGMAANIQLHS